MSKHPFDAYRSRHDQQPTVRLRSGVQQLTVEFHRGYVHIRSSAPYSGEIYVTRSAFITLLRRVMPIVRLWIRHPAQDWDVPKAVHEYYLQELELSRALREQKKKRRPTLEDHERAQRQHRRWLAARARAQRRAASS